MYKLGKLYSNMWIRVADDNFAKLLQIQKDYELKSIDEVLELLVNTRTIDLLAKKSKEHTSAKNSMICSKVS